MRKLNLKAINRPGDMTLDAQLAALPKEIVFCKNCVVSNQRPRTVFNAEGICSACIWAYEKDFVVDWKSRERELQELCDKYRSKDGSWDVVVPGSGGKDSAFTAHLLKTKYGMHPLCVTWAPFEYTDIGWKNLNRFVQSGFTNLVAQQDGIIHRKLARLAFDLKGDAWEPFSYGQKSWAFHVALRFNINLIFYGENGELEYGGSEKYKHRPCEGTEEWEYEYFKGASVDALIKEGLSRGIFNLDELLQSKSVIELYRPPNPALIQESHTEMHWLSYYIKWTPQENYYYAATHTSFEPNDEGRTESTYTKYASLDDKADGFHFYLGYMKFGLGRCSRDAQQDIRRNHITRQEGVALVKRYDHEFPQKYFKWFLEYLDITEDYFWSTMNKYRERSNAWEKQNGDWVLRTIVT